MARNIIARVFRERIIEYCLDSTDGELVSQTVKEFIGSVGKNYLLLKPFKA